MIMIKNIIIIIACILPLHVQAILNDSIKERGQSAATKSSTEVHLLYLQCYALNPLEKKVCVDELANMYIEEKYNENQQYKVAFQHESEKLGFLTFIHNNNQKCKKIVEGPGFVDKQKAYKVICTCGNTYFMKFDYEKGKWKLI